ncbi:hypothetical protein [Marinoscillum furvescens]|uniref:Uncharacterized protein n=1 Tax=Marinoscillum furvescens DSM 4134 TaxID=1122208 RepID=A0A3D9LJX7_MARFU|nr:hypothetical protein [Marinoscillum furvescens]REE05946.1 hypothetical protein C7460_101465 [Marinoscillum furvescens DSM 4134]
MKRKTILQALTFVAVCWLGGRLFAFLAKEYGFTLSIGLGASLAIGMLLLVSIAVGRHLRK